MTRKKDAVQTHFKKLVVQLIPREKNAFPRRGYGLHYTDDLSVVTRYLVLATYLYQYNDGSTALAFLITDEFGGGPVLERACTLFKAVEVEGQD